MRLKSCFPSRPGHHSTREATGDARSGVSESCGGGACSCTATAKDVKEIATARRTLKSKILKETSGHIQPKGGFTSVNAECYDTWVLPSPSVCADLMECLSDRGEDRAMGGRHDVGRTGKVFASCLEAVVLLRVRANEACKRRNQERRQKDAKTGIKCHGMICIVLTPHVQPKNHQETQAQEREETASDHGAIRLIFVELQSLDLRHVAHLLDQKDAEIRGRLLKRAPERTKDHCTAG